MTLLNVIWTVYLTMLTFTLGIYMGRFLERRRCAELVNDWPDPYPPRWIVADAIRGRR